MNTVTPWTNSSHQKRYILRVKTKTNSTENFHQHVVLCNDVAGLIDYVVAKRTINQESMLIRIGMDGGGGFMKVSLSLFDMLQPEQSSGKILIKKFKNSGVKWSLFSHLFQTSWKTTGTSKSSG